MKSMLPDSRQDGESNDVLHLARLAYTDNTVMDPKDRLNTLIPLFGDLTGGTYYISFSTAAA